MELNSQGKTEVLGENPVPVPLCLPQITHGLTRVSNPGLRFLCLLKVSTGRFKAKPLRYFDGFETCIPRLEPIGVF
jgi:hypothetical protein